VKASGYLSVRRDRSVDVESLGRPAIGCQASASLAMDKQRSRKDGSMLAMLESDTGKERSATRDQTDQTEAEGLL
jgi:hypothetical protein